MFVWINNGFYGKGMSQTGGLFYIHELGISVFISDIIMLTSCWAVVSGQA